MPKLSRFVSEKLKLHIIYFGILYMYKKYGQLQELGYLEKYEFKLKLKMKMCYYVTIKVKFIS